MRQTPTLAPLQPLDADGLQPPERFTWPFDYTPHPLVERAAARLQARLAQMQGPLRAEADAGKMFGVLVVSSAQGLGYLSAFSAQWGGSFLHEGFVPPLFNYPADATVAAGFAALERLTSSIEAFSSALQIAPMCAKLNELQDRLAEEYRAKAAEFAADRTRRHALRRVANLSADELARLQGESRFQKAELRRLRHRQQALRQAAAAPLQAAQARLDEAGEQRKALSHALQQLIFEHSRVLSAQGEERSLSQIFAPTAQRVPPSGAGECCGPKLLQYAYRHRLTPLCMGEFWWGRSPRGLVRRHAQYYPACAGKCGPILRFMLQGLPTDPDPQCATTTAPLRVVFEDDCLAVVDKPAGMPSVPGHTGRPSVQSFMSERWNATAYMPHRIDQDTSGLLLVARDAATYRALQAGFRARKVSKTYEALLCGVPPAGSRRRGCISLPLAPDYVHRPAQCVDREKGRPATTLYLFLSTQGGQTRVLLRPLTGRTHQLRVHCAHAEGLYQPIVGDPLYGRRGQRLCLHARRLAFVHPSTGRRLSFVSPAPF